MLKRYKPLLLIIMLVLSSILSYYLYNTGPNPPGLKNLNEIFTITEYDKDDLKRESDLQILLNEYSGLIKNRDSIYLLIKNINDSIISLEKEYKVFEDSIIRTEQLISSKVNNSILFYRDTLLLYERIDLYNKNLSSIRSLLSSLEKKKDNLSGPDEERIAKVLEEIRGLTGVFYGSSMIVYKGVSYHLFVTHPEQHNIMMHLRSSSGANFINIASVLKDKDHQDIKFLMITNGGMYTPQYQPQGLFIQDGVEVVKLDTSHPKTNANFYLMPNGVYALDTNNRGYVSTSEKFSLMYEQNRQNIKYATQSGPMLVIDGKIHPSFTYGSNNKKIRSGVGIIEGKSVFIISLQETNFYDFASLFKDIFGCKDALYLDGVISLMYLKDLNPGETGGTFGPIISVSALSSDTLISPIIDVSSKSDTIKN